MPYLLGPQSMTPQDQDSSDDKSAPDAVSMAPKAQQVKAASTPHQHPSPFLRIPGEIRNGIYGYVFGGEVARTHPAYDRKHSWIYSTHLLSLTLTCRQTYHETYTLPFTLGTFRGPTRDVMLCLQHALTEAQSQAVTSVCFQIGEYDIRFRCVVVILDKAGKEQCRSRDPVLVRECAALAKHFCNALREVKHYRGVKKLRVECRSSGVYEEYGPVQEQQSRLQCQEREVVAEIGKRLRNEDGEVGIKIEMGFIL